MPNQDAQKLTEPQKALVQAIMGYARKTRQSWASRLGGISGGERLTERDWTLMEWLSEKGEVRFSEAVKYLKGKSGDSGTSEAAITQAIGRMTKNWRLLRARRTKEDERKKTLALTTKGEQVMQRRRDVREEMYVLIFRTWAPLDDEFCARITKMFLDGIKRADEVFGIET